MLLLKRLPKLPLYSAVVTLMAALVLSLFAFQGFGSPQAGAAEDCQTFQTGYQVCGRFLTYWRQNGGLAQQGNPISAVFEEKNADPPAGDGQVHRVQYFERARFEEHAENPAPYDVLLGLIGTEQYRAKYGVKDPNAQLMIIRGKRTETKIGDHTPKPGWIYVVVDLLITNTTAKPLIVSPDSITLRTAQIYDYKVSDATYASERYLKLTTLSINQNVGGELAYEIPQTDNPVSITMDYFDNKVTANFS
jgi:hypothetical protein